MTNITGSSKEPALADYIAKWSKVELVAHEQERAAREEHAREVIAWLRNRLTEAQEGINWWMAAKDRAERRTADEPEVRNERLVASNEGERSPEQHGRDSGLRSAEVPYSPPVNSVYEVEFASKVLDDADKALAVLFTMLTKEKLRQGAMVADEIRGNVRAAIKQLTHLRAAQPPPAEPAAYIVVVRGNGQRHEFATLPLTAPLSNGTVGGPDVALDPDQELVSAVPLYRHAQPPGEALSLLQIAETAIRTQHNPPDWWSGRVLALLGERPARGDAPRDFHQVVMDSAVVGLRNLLELALSHVDLSALEVSHKKDWAMLVPFATRPKCGTCNDRGEVGGFVNAESGYQIDPCPDCSGTTKEV